jgi:hypothetical protein
MLNNKLSKVRERFSELFALTNTNMQEEWEDLAIEAMSRIDDLEEILREAVDIIEAHTAQFDTIADPDGGWNIKYVAEYPQDVKKFLSKVKR